MKTLYLLRHAKSSWGDASLPDRNRPLEARGERDAAKASKRWSQRIEKPALIMSSPAARALITHMPTCALVEFRFEASTWADIGRARPSRTIVDSPKQPSA